MAVIPQTFVLTNNTIVRTNSVNQRLLGANSFMMVCALYHGIPYTSAQYIYNSCGYTTPRVRSFPRLTGSVWIHLGLHLTHGEPVTRVVTNLGLKKTLNVDAMRRATLCIVLVLIITHQPAQIAIFQL